MNPDDLYSHILSTDGTYYDGSGWQPLDGGQGGAQYGGRDTLARARMAAQAVYQQQQQNLGWANYDLAAHKQAYDQIPKDQVFTGHDSQTMQQTPDVMDAVNYGVHRYLNPGQAPFMRIGNDLYDGGGQRTTDAALQAANAARASMTPQDRMNAAGNAVWSDPRFANLDALQRSQAYMHLKGVDPLSEQDRAQAQLVKQMEFAKNMQGMQAEQRKALLDEYRQLGESAAGKPEDILASFGRNTAAGHQNEYFNPGVDMGVDPTTGEHKIEKAGWRGIDPGTVDRLRQLRAGMGMGTQPQMDIQALRSREAELLAKANQGPASTTTPLPSAPPSGGLPPIGPLRMFGGDFWRKMGRDIVGDSTPSVPVASTYDYTYQRGGPSSVPWWLFGSSR